MKLLISFFIAVITWGIVYSLVTFLIAIIFNIDWNEVKLFPLCVIFFGLFVSTPLSIYVAEDVYNNIN